MKDIFCTKCQLTTSHEATVDGNGEFVFSCQADGCDRFLKLPADFLGEGLDEYLAQCQEENQGQVSLEEQEIKLAAMLTE